MIHPEAKRHPAAVAYRSAMAGYWRRLRDLDRVATRKIFLELWMARRHYDVMEGHAKGLEINVAFLMDHITNQNPINRSLMIH